MSGVRVVRWDTGREHEIPEEALRWGPDTKQGTCRTQLLRAPGWRADVALLGDVPYVLPFEGAKWAVRVALLASAASGSSAESETLARADERFRRAIFDKTDREILGRRRGLADEAFLVHGGLRPRDREKLGSLLEAAADALGAEAEEDRPDALGEALELLAEAIGWLQDSEDFPKERAFRREVVAFLERETSAEIRRAWEGAERG